MRTAGEPFMRWTLRCAKRENQDLSVLVTRGARARGARARGTRAQGARARGARARGTRARGARARGARARGARARGARREARGPRRESPRSEVRSPRPQRERPVTARGLCHTRSGQTIYSTQHSYLCIMRDAKLVTFATISSINSRKNIWYFMSRQYVVCASSRQVEECQPVIAT